METELVRENTSPEINKNIDNQIQENINYYYNDPVDIEYRLWELDKEWDIERVLELNASSLILYGLLLSLVVNRKWLLVPLAVSGLLAYHAVKGWCPPLPILRRLGFRTRAEIDKEKYALKALRGDFKYLLDVPNVVWDAVNR